MTGVPQSPQPPLSASHGGGAGRSPPLSFCSHGALSPCGQKAGPRLSSVLEFLYKVSL